VFVRRLALSLFVGAVLAGSTAGISSAGGYKISLAVINPVPPVLNVTLPATCHVHFDSGNTELNCIAIAPNPNPPKDTKTVKIPVESPKGSCKLTAYPDGGVVVACRVKGVAL